MQYSIITTCMDMTAALKHCKRQHYCCLLNKCVRVTVRTSLGWSGARAGFGRKADGPKSGPRLPGPSALAVWDQILVRSHQRPPRQPGPGTGSTGNHLSILQSEIESKLLHLRPTMPHVHHTPEFQKRSAPRGRNLCNQCENPALQPLSL